MTTISIPCSACAEAPRFRQYCHECGGRGFIERPVPPPPGCTGQLPECPFTFDPMVGYGVCRNCGRKGEA